MSRLTPHGMKIGAVALWLLSIFPESGKNIRISLTEPVRLRFLYPKENQKFETHMELEWLTHRKNSPFNWAMSFS